MSEPAWDRFCAAGEVIVAAALVDTGAPRFAVVCVIMATIMLLRARGLEEGWWPRGLGAKPVKEPELPRATVVAPERPGERSRGPAPRPR